ncbi:MAG: flagellar type III secretion system pore protein FliP [Polyangiales bacterium]
MNRRGSVTLALAALAATLAPAIALADPAQPSGGLLNDAGLSPQLKILALLTVLSLLPAIVLTMTSFTRVIIVLGFVRHGVGTQQSPPTQVLVGIALFITAFTMAPVANTIAHDAWGPYSNGQITGEQALERATTPLRSFMLRQTRETDLALFYEAARQPLPSTEEEVPLRIAAPAFVVSELTTAFQMGVLVLLPFLVIDLVVSSLLMSMGMMMVPPTTLSLPIKLMLFVLADGWHLLVGSLLRSFT